MNQERMLGIMHNLLLEMQDGGLLDDAGVTRVCRCLINNLQSRKSHEDGGKG